MRKMNETLRWTLVGLLAWGSGLFQATCYTIPNCTPGETTLATGPAGYDVNADCAVGTNEFAAGLFGGWSAAVLNNVVAGLVSSWFNVPQSPFGGFGT